MAFILPTRPYTATSHSYYSIKPFSILILNKMTLQETEKHFVDCQFWNFKTTQWIIKLSLFFHCIRFAYSLNTFFLLKANTRRSSPKKKLFLFLRNNRRGKYYIYISFLMNINMHKDKWGKDKGRGGHTPVCDEE